MTPTPGPNGERTRGNGDRAQKRTIAFFLVMSHVPTPQRSTYYPIFSSGLAPWDLFKDYLNLHLLPPFP